jgi:Glu-tRNA(Gln) amidotransferase subunit E-like FAD-binding protein
MIILDLPRILLIQKQSAKEQHMKENLQPNLWESRKKEKEIVTHYLDKSLVDLIADFIHETRKELPTAKRKKLNRTLVISLIMNEVMTEYSQFKDESFLARLIKKWKNE